MEWVIAALAMGCVFFTFQVVMDYVRYRSVIKPRMEQLEQTRAELKQRLAQAQGDVEERRGELDPLRTQVEEIEAERMDLERRLQDERSRPPAAPASGRRRDGKPLSE
jgi:chromosome segregation ATPase